VAGSSHARGPGVRLRAPRFTYPRVLFAMVLATAGALLIVYEFQLRVLEVAVAAWVNRLVLGGIVTTGWSDGEPSVTFGSPKVGYTVIVTVECAIALYLAALLWIGATLALIPRLSLWQVLVSTMGAVAGMILLNQVLLFVLEMSLWNGGLAVFEWMHSLVGSLLMLFGLATCLFVFFRVAVSKTRVGRHRRTRWGN